MPLSIVRALAVSLPLSLAASASLGLPAVAAEAAGDAPTIAVSAEGRAAMKPDMAIVEFSVLKQAKTAKGALDDNNTAMAAVIEALKGAGVAERDLQTSGFSVQPQYVYSQGKDGQQSPPQLVGYQVSNSLSVRLRDLSRLGAVLDQAVGLGINQGGQIQFVNDDPAGAFEEARRKAVTNAMAKARTLADAAGVKLGKPIQISEQAAPLPVAPSPVFRAAAMKQEADAAVPVESGENSYSVNVDMRFSIVE